MTLPRLTAFVLALLAVVHAPSLAHAQAITPAIEQPVEPVRLAPSPAAPRPAAVGDRGARVRFGLGAAIGLLVGTQTFGGGAVGGQLDAGLQINDRFAIYVRGIATTLVIPNYASVALMFEYTPLPALSIALGPILDGYGLLQVFGPQPERDVGASLLVAYNMTHRLRDGRRQGFRATFEAIAGANSDGVRGGVLGVGVGGMIGLGYVTM